MVQPAENTVDLQKLQRKLHYKSTKTCIHQSAFSEKVVLD